MRQGCLLCGKWVMSGHGVALVVRGNLTCSNDGRFLHDAELHGAICDEHFDADGNLTIVQILTQNKSLVGENERLQHELREAQKRCDELWASLEKLKVAKSTIVNTDWPVRIEIR